MATSTNSTTGTTARSPEPWGIWAGILVVILALVVAFTFFGLPGLAAVMVAASGAMLVALVLIVFG
ncbi:MAG: hypothetical protein JJT99_00360 [Rhodobacteraceae bacterium]|nr:hypothetical protein [Paracoccaceae bacterium]